MPWNLKWIHSQLNRLLELEDTYTYHIYEEVWSSVIEVLVCRRDTRNRHDPFAVATFKSTTVVGHVPSFVAFLGKPGASIILCCRSVAGSRGCRNVLVVAKYPA